MCEQCLADAQTIVPEVLPGYTLMRSRKDAHHWPAGWYGLVQQNDPVLVFPGPIREDPLSAPMSEAEGAERGSTVSRLEENYQSSVSTLQQQLLRLHVVVGYKLVTACIAAGYDIERDGHELAFWLMDYMAKEIKSEQSGKRKVEKLVTGHALFLRRIAFLMLLCPMDTENWVKYLTDPNVLLAELVVRSLDKYASFGSKVLWVDEFSIAGLTCYLRGENPSFSTSISEELTAGFGKLDEYGDWEFPIPYELVETVKQLQAIS